MKCVRRAAWCLALVVGLCAGRASAAESPEDVSRAKTHFEAGRALYSLGNFEHALREFTSGYNLVPKPRFLLNIAHCHRKLGQFDKSRETYHKFLAEVPGDDPDRAEAQRYLAEVDKAQPAQPVIVPVVTAPPAPPREPTLTAQPSEPKKKPAYVKHLAWAIPVGAAVVIGLTVGIYFGTRPGTDCTGETLGCFTVMP